MCEVGRWEQALEHLDSIERLQWVDEQGARNWRALILAALDRFDEALDAIGTAHETEPWSIGVAAILHARKGNRERAEDLLSQAQTMQIPDLCYIEARVNTALGRHESALTGYESEMQGIGRVPESARFAGEALMQLGHPREARAGFAFTIRHRPYLLPDDLRRLANACDALGDRGGAAAWNEIAHESELQDADSGET